MSPVIPGQSPKYSGVIDSRFLSDLAEKVARLEALRATAGRAYRGSIQSIPTSTWTKIKLDNVVAGTNPGSWSLANGWYVVPTTGIYLTTGCVAVSTGPAEEGMAIAALWVNEGERLRGERVAGKPGDSVTNRVFCGLSFEEAGAKLELRVFHTFPAEREIELSPVQNCLSVLQVQ